MNHITQEQAAKFADQAEIDTERILQDTGEYHPDHWQVEAHLLCNAAIELYIAQQAAPKECGNTPYDEGPFTIVEEQAAPSQYGSEELQALILAKLSQQAEPKEQI